ncbi:MAG: 3H domain-containing protein [Butyricicoccaceae bacterium]
MNAAERRTKITELLAASDRPMSATALAARCGVSRQIIVGDVALLRAGGMAVMATPRGYILENAASAPAYAERRIVAHHDEDRLREELYTIVDLGGAAIDVTVEHSIYGQITAPLHIFSRVTMRMPSATSWSTSKARPLVRPHGRHPSAYLCARRTKGRSTA